MDSTRLDTVLKYREHGFSILPANGKVPAVKRLKPYLDSRIIADEHQLTDWFDRTDFKVCGTPSGGLVFADFDDPLGYPSWARRYPELAAPAPTVQTGRGNHVYTHSDLTGVKRMPSGGEHRGNRRAHEYHFVVRGAK